MTNMYNENLLSCDHKTLLETVRKFISIEIKPYASQFDKEQNIPQELILKLANHGYLGANLPTEYGGAGIDSISYGFVHKEFSSAYASISSLLTVHNMVAKTIARWANKDQCDFWLPKLSTGILIAAFALSEPNIGSDASHIETTAVMSGDEYVINGTKKWISFGQIADIFLVMAMLNNKPCAFILDKANPGITITPITDMLGLRGSMLAELHLEDCKVPKCNVIGRTGFGLSHICSYALEQGRYCVAWACVGIGQACLDASMEYIRTRKQFGKYLKDHQLIQRMICNMITELKASEALCRNAGLSKDSGAPECTMDIMISKYFASKMAARAANNAVQIFGANGCHGILPIERYYRDAKGMEIIEGTNEILQLQISKYGYNTLDSVDSYL